MLKSLMPRFGLIMFRGSAYAALMLILLIGLLSLRLPIEAFARNGPDGWAMTYGGFREDNTPSSIHQTRDGGFIVAGTKLVFGPLQPGPRVAWVLKLDRVGEVQWQKMFGDTSYSLAGDIAETVDGGYVLAGSHQASAASSSGSAPVTAWILKLDSFGNVVWQRSYGPAGADALRIQPTTDGGYVVAGDVAVPGFSLEKAWIFKIDSDGNIIWQKYYAESGAFSRFETIQQTSDGGYIVAGRSSGFFGIVSGWVLKLDQQGEPIWQEALGAGRYSWINSVQQVADGGYFTGGYTDGTAWLVRLDSSGQVLWQEGISGSVTPSLTFAGITAVDETRQGDLVAVGQIDVSGVIIRLEEGGKILWQRTLAGDIATSLDQTRGGGYVVGLHSFSFSTTGGDILIASLDRQGFCCSTVSTTSIPSIAVNTPTVLQTSVSPTVTDSNAETTIVAPVDTQSVAVNHCPT